MSEEDIALLANKDLFAVQDCVKLFDKSLADKKVGGTSSSSTRASPRRR